MKEITNDATLGEIVFEESFWTGKKSLTVNGEVLTKVDKKTFRFADGRNATIKGSMLFGAKMITGGNEITVSGSLKWFEYVLALVIPVFVMIWGNVPSLCAMFPLVGGAIGGVLSVLGMYLSVVLMKRTHNVALKILIGLGVFVATVLVCYLIALGIISAANAVA